MKVSELTKYLKEYEDVIAQMNDKEGRLLSALQKNHLESLYDIELAALLLDMAKLRKRFHALTTYYYAVGGIKLPWR